MALGFFHALCFMLSNDVKVKTRHYKSKNKYLIELEKGNEWTSLTESEDVTFDGTEVVLNYADFIEVFESDPQEVKKFLNQYFLTDGVDFELIEKSEEKKYKIINPISLLSPPKKGLIKIDFQDYLKDIEGYALIKNNSAFIKKFDEIDFPGTLYRYDDKEGLLEVTDFSNLKIDDYISGQEIRYLLIPLIESGNEDDFLSGLNFTGGDLDEVIDKMDRELYTGPP